MSEYPKDMVLGVIACAGEFPRQVITGAHRAGVRVVSAGMRGAVGPEIPGMSDAYECFRVGSIEGPADFFLKHGVTHVMLTGQIKPSCIYTMWPDATARRLLKTLDRRNAHTIFGTVCDFIHSKGMEVLPSITFMEEQLPAPGHIAGPPPTPEQLDEAKFGLAQAREIARLDIGQSIIVHGHKVVCVEAFKGTNECLHAGGHRATIYRRHALQPGGRLLQGKLRCGILPAAQAAQMRHQELLRPLPQPGRKRPGTQRKPMPQQIQHACPCAACKRPLQPGKRPRRHHTQPPTGQAQRKCRALLCDAASLAQPPAFVKELTIDE